jgi:hypothetical protein
VGAGNEAGLQQQFNTTRRQKETEVALLVQRHEAELRQLEAQFTDEQKSVN